MSPLLPHPAHPSRRRRIWSTVGLVGIGGLLIAVWFTEVVLHAQEVLGLILLVLMAGVIISLHLLIFRSCNLPREDDPKAPDRGGGK